MVANAEARIEGDTVVVHSDRVEHPLAVRYGWANDPLGNLWNKQDLPASPFRTDLFPMTTVPRPREVQPGPRRWRQDPRRLLLSRRRRSGGIGQGKETRLPDPWAQEPVPILHVGSTFSYTPLSRQFPCFPEEWRTRI